MSVVLTNEVGCLVDHEKFINLTCDSTQYKTYEHFFKISKPYINTKDGTAGLLKSSDTAVKKQRKRKLPLNIGEVQALEYHGKVKVKIEAGLNMLTQLEQWKDYFKHVEHTNSETQSFLKAASDSCDILQVSEKYKLNFNPLFPVKGSCYTLNDVVNRVVHNRTEVSLLLVIFNTKYIIPAGSKFLISDIIYLDNFVPCLDSTYDLIVIDPPWENKSVKRGAKYSSLSLREIKQLPIPRLASNQAIVVVWVTNKQKYRKFILNELFPSWSCMFVAEWHWIKLTKQGEMIHALDSSHKKPYEPFLIGKFKKDNEWCKSEEYDSSEEWKVKQLPEHQLLCSVPCSLHSRKPPLNDILKDYLPKDPKCIELFARNLTPNWTSWGNEVLKYQHEDYYQKKGET